MAKTILTKIYHRNDTSSNWVTANPVLGKGEIGIESDTRKFKFGDGVTIWKDLGYAGISLSDVPLASATMDGLMAKNDYSKLLAIATGAQVNVIESVSVNGTALGITSKGVNIVVPKGTLASKDTVAQSDLDTALAGVITSLVSDKHTHSNKAALDTITSANISSWDGKADKSTTIAGYGITNAYTKAEVDGIVAAVFKYKGVKATYAELPATGNKIGDVWHVTANSGEYAWDGNAWQELGSTIDLSAYATKAYVDTELAKKVDKVTGKSLIADTDVTKLSGIATGATKTEASATNGNIKVNGTETPVYTLPTTVVQSTDTLILNGGTASTTYN